MGWAQGQRQWLSDDLGSPIGVDSHKKKEQEGVSVA